MNNPDARFDALLDAMLKKPPLDVSAEPEPDDSDDLREPEDD